MMDWYRLPLYFLMTGIRIYLCLGLVAVLLKFSKPTKPTVLLSLGGAAVVTILAYFVQSQFYLLGIEIVLLLVFVGFLFSREVRMCLFVIFFYEIAVALWEFLIAAGLGILLGESRFVNDRSRAYLLAVLVVRLLMIGLGVFLKRKAEESERGVFRLISGVAVLGMLGVVSVSEQNILPLDEDSLTTWVILSLILLLSVLFFHINRQYEMEKEIAQLKAEQMELLERDFQTLNRSYSMNAELFHDLHNHIEILRRFLTQEKTTDALQYLAELQTPMQEAVQTVWTGDEATDYLINSKIARAQQLHIKTTINIEFPRHTSIRSADLTAILGNLLDNALEGCEKSQAAPHFIRLTIRRIHEMLIIKVENDCEGISLDSKLATTKSDGGLHGWGLKSARAAVERYEGTVETSYADNLFCAVATLSYHSVKPNP